MITWSLDTETTGSNPFLGCRPFLIEAISDKGDHESWEAPVDPHTRVPQWSRTQKKEITKFLSSPQRKFVMHNSKFDRRMIHFAIGYLIPWDRIEDTLPLSHVLISGESHKLKDLSEKFLDISKEDVEDLRKACISARRIAKKLGWRIAEEGDPHFPTQRSGSKSKGDTEDQTSWWKMDMWLPKAVATYLNYDKEHPWYTVCHKYCFTDVLRTLPLYELLQDKLLEEGYQSQYRWRMAQIAATYEMENNGMTVNLSNLKEQISLYSQEVEKAEKKCKSIFDINLNSPKQKVDLFYNRLNLPILKTTKKGNPSTDSDTLKNLIELLPDLSYSVIKNKSRRKKITTFIENLLNRSKYSTAQKYLEGYQKALIDIPTSYIPDSTTKHKKRKILSNWSLIRPRINPTGTNTLRPTSSNPNGQNISKKGETNLRRVFSPYPGRVWYAIDYSNIEMRIFAYACGDQNLIAAFDQDKSVHIEFAKAVYEEEWNTLLATYDSSLPKELIEKEVAEDFKSRYKDTLYQWVKNGDFAIIYGATESTTNDSYRRDDAYQKIVKKLPLVEEFILTKLEEATDKGYIHTIGGYRLDVKSKYRCKLRSIACNYFVQGSARWFMVKASVMCHHLCKQWNEEEGLTSEQGYKIIMDVHDELIFDFPDRDNTEKLHKIKEVMECVGDPYNIPTLVEIDEIKTNWSEGKRIL